mmetsp:Transcript_21806/g.53655  ORF Transcript_21806/g.53655 Transcript_21806/m.53655 type:complete len:93 (-) Transcript_21806:83-361(-)
MVSPAVQLVVELSPRALRLFCRLLAATPQHCLSLWNGCRFYYHLKGMGQLAELGWAKGAARGLTTRSVSRAAPPRTSLCRCPVPGGRDCAIC